MHHAGDILQCMSMRGTASRTRNTRMPIIIVRLCLMTTLS